jgi:hypothetical protein
MEKRDRSSPRGSNGRGTTGVSSSRAYETGFANGVSTRIPTATTAPSAVAFRRANVNASVRRRFRAIRTASTATYIAAAKSITTAVFFDANARPKQIPLTIGRLRRNAHDAASTNGASTAS